MRNSFLTILFTVLSLSLTVAYAETKFSMRQWMQLDPAKKLAVITVAIQDEAANKVFIRLPPSHYVEALDELAANTIANGNGGDLDSQSVGVTFKTIAVMDCDWDNGQDRLEFAKQLMGPKTFAVFQDGYPDKYKRLVNGCR